MTQPVPKRADQLVVGDRILQEFLPGSFYDGPGEILFIRTNVARNSVSVFFEQDNGNCDCQTFVLDGRVEVYPGAPVGHDYSRADDGEQPGPVAGRIPPHFEDGRPVVEVAGGLVEIDPPEGFIPAYEPGLIVGDTAAEQRDNAYAAYERDEAECPSAWHVNQGDQRSRCPICNQAD